MCIDCGPGYIYGDEGCSHTQPKNKTESGRNDLGPSTFANSSFTVINHKGENFYKSCGQFVKEQSDNSVTSCIKRINHPGITHEDYYGNVRTFGKAVIILEFEERTENDSLLQNIQKHFNTEDQMTIGVATGIVAADIMDVFRKGP